MLGNVSNSKCPCFSARKFRFILPVDQSAVKVDARQLIGNNNSNDNLKYHLKKIDLVYKVQELECNLASLQSRLDVAKAPFSKEACDVIKLLKKEIMATLADLSKNKNELMSLESNNSKF